MRRAGALLALLIAAAAFGDGDEPARKVDSAAHGGVRADVDRPKPVFMLHERDKRVHGLKPFQELVDAAPAGATLKPAPGSYAGPVRLDKPLVIDGGGQVTIDAGGKGTVFSLETDGAVLRGLTLPDFYAITHAGGIGVEAQMEKLERALAGGLRLLQIREPSISVEKREAFAREATRLAHAQGARVLVNGDVALAGHVGADGVHLPCARLMQLESRPDLPLVAASCHNAPELARAAALELDFAVLGPAKETLSHPGVAGLGWERVAHLLENMPFPVLAIGGLDHADLDAARQAGAHGIAAIRAIWRPVRD